MALPSNGKMTMEMITTEFKAPRTTPLSSFYRGGQYVKQNNTKVPTSGKISFSDFYDATSMLVVVHDVNQDSLFLDVNLILASYQWDGVTPVDLTINVASGVVIYSNTTSKPALHITPITADSVVRINNSGYIIGMGGTGRDATNQEKAEDGGTSILIEETSIINNTGTIGGGGGGGASTRRGNFAAGGGGGQTGKENSKGGLGLYGDQRQAGKPGTFAWAGGGGDAQGFNGYGGVGGLWGQNGGNATGSGTIGTPGLGGNALVGNNKVTWINQGIIAGALV